MVLICFSAMVLVPNDQFCLVVNKSRSKFDLIWLTCLSATGFLNLDGNSYQK